MSITDKTRKILWAHSGNRCLLCKTELAQKTDDNSINVIIGEECHIISASKNGPRGNVEYDKDHDGYENLMLLCANHHKEVDELTDKYTVTVLHLVKGLHEQWVKTTLERDVTTFANDQLNVKSLPRVKTGQQALEIVRGAHMFDFNHDELKTEEEASLVGGLLEELKDTGDILGDMSFEDVAKFGIYISKQLEEMHAKGFCLFGLKRRLRMKFGKDQEADIYDTASLVVVRKDNPSIVEDFLIARFPKNVQISL